MNKEPQPMPSLNVLESVIVTMVRALDEYEELKGSAENNYALYLREKEKVKALLEAAKKSLKEIKGKNIFDEEVNPELVDLLEKTITQAEGK